VAEVHVEGAQQLRELAKRLRAADPVIRRELVKSLRPEVRKVTDEVKATVRAAPSHGRKGLGHRRRAAHTLSRTRRISEASAKKIATKKHGVEHVRVEHVEAVKAARRTKQAAKAAAGAGLRETIANATTSSITTGSAVTGVSVTWRVRASKLANSQRKLPKDFNSRKGWRHPVFGDRKNWVVQYGTPYFDDVIKRHNDYLRDRAVDGMQRAADSICKGESAP
jgi:hypothetical protein